MEHGLCVCITMINIIMSRKRKMHFELEHVDVFIILLKVVSQISCQLNTSPDRMSFYQQKVKHCNSCWIAEKEPSNSKT